MDIIRKIENILGNEMLKADNQYGYEITIDTILKINKLGYGLRMMKNGVGYFKLLEG